MSTRSQTHFVLYGQFEHAEGALTNLPIPSLTPVTITTFPARESEGELGSTAGYTPACDWFIHDKLEAEKSAGRSDILWRTRESLLALWRLKDVLIPETV